MMEMPSEFGTAKELRQRVSDSVAVALIASEMVKKSKTLGLDMKVEELKVLLMMQAAQLEWALAAIDELQGEVAMLRGDGRR